MPVKNNYKEYETDFELLYLAESNDEEANELIYKKYEPVIRYYAKKYNNLVEGKGIDYNDLAQEGLIGLINAIDNFKNQKNIKFSTFAFICIKRRIISAVRDANRKKHSILNESYSLDYKLGEDEKELMDIAVTTNGSVEDILVSKENNMLFNKMLSKSLSDFEKMVFDLRINNFTYDEIAHTLGKTEKSIERALSRIREKIKTILQKIN